MKLLTLTPEAHVYVVALLSVSALACAPSAELVRALWPTRARPRFLPVYTATLATVAALAVAALELPSVTQTSRARLVESVFLGLLAGGAASWCDESIRQAFQRQALRAESVGGRRPRSVVPLAAAIPHSLPPARDREPSNFGASSLALLVSIATLEELLFRGVLVDLSLELSATLAALCITASVLFFAGSHVYWGWEEVIAKLPLGLAALLASLPFRAVLGAVAAHVVFNTRSWLAGRAAEAARARPA